MGEVRRCGVAFGSNLGDRFGNLRAARGMLLARVAAEGEEVFSSPVFETEPVDCEEGSPRFLNAVVEMGTEFEPGALLEVVQEIERELGRPAGHGVNTPRTVDLDILYVGELEVSGGRLELPHPRMEGRMFVLEPLSRIRPDLRVVGSGATVAEVLEGMGDDEGCVEVAGMDWVEGN